MRLEAKDMALDLDDRFRREIADLPGRIKLEGNPMQCEIASRLLGKHAPHVEIAEDGQGVQLMSVEAWGARHLAAYLEGQDEPKGRILLCTLPEELLVRYAEHHGIPIVREQHDDARKLLEEISAAQPQTPFSLARSIGRLPGK